MYVFLLFIGPNHIDWLLLTLTSCFGPILRLSFCQMKAKVMWGFVFPLAHCCVDRHPSPRSSALAAFYSTCNNFKYISSPDFHSGKLKFEFLSIFISQVCIKWNAIPAFNVLFSILNSFFLSSTHPLIHSFTHSNTKDNEWLYKIIRVRARAWARYTFIQKGARGKKVKKIWWRL